MEYSISFYADDELKALPFKRIGKGVKLSRKASFYNPSHIEIGDFVRIDDFCVLSAGAGGIVIGRNVHIAVYSSLIGMARITLHDFVGLSSRVSVYSSSDDFSGVFMTNPTVCSEYTNVTNKPVEICRHVIIGAGSVILPGVTLHEGCAVGALSLVKNDCEPWTIYVGSPVKKVACRHTNLLMREKSFLESFLD